MSTYNKTFLDNMKLQDEEKAAIADAKAAEERAAMIGGNLDPGIAEVVDSTVVREVDKPRGINKAAKKSPTTKKSQKQTDIPENDVSIPEDLAPVAKAAKKKLSPSGSNIEKSTIDEAAQRFTIGIKVLAQHDGALRLASMFEGKDRSGLIREAIEVYYKKYFDSCDKDGKPHIMMSETKR